jgi:hypothetical protein
MSPSAKKQLLGFTGRRDAKKVKALLQSVPREDKGPLFEWYLGQLYAGNGWLVQLTGRTRDCPLALPRLAAGKLIDFSSISPVT